LAWMELTGLSRESVDVLRKVIPVYNEHQKNIHGGIIYPIGQRPNGTSWTGFQSTTSEDSGYLLIIREHNDEKSAKIKLNGISGKTVTLTNILGSGKQNSIYVDESGFAEFELDKHFQYALYLYKM